MKKFHLILVGFLLLPFVLCAQNTLEFQTGVFMPLRSLGHDVYRLQYTDFTPKEIAHLNPGFYAELDGYKKTRKLDVGIGISNVIASTNPYAFALSCNPEFFRYKRFTIKSAQNAQLTNLLALFRKNFFVHQPTQLSFEAKIGASHLNAREILIDFHNNATAYEGRILNNSAWGYSTQLSSSLRHTQNSWTYSLSMMYSYGELNLRQSVHIPDMENIDQNLDVDPEYFNFPWISYSNGVLQRATYLVVSAGISRSF